MLRSEPRIIVLALERGDPFPLFLPLALSSAFCVSLPSPSQRQRCCWKVAGRGCFFWMCILRRAVLPDRNRCQSSCALKVALQAAAPDVRMAAIAQKRYCRTSFIIRSPLQAWPALFFWACFPCLFRVCLFYVSNSPKLGTMYWETSAELVVQCADKA